ncbi:MAG: glycosyltransferase [Candidatus Hydrogenedentes bacterium]|nr:glycosyltransferase [Candidatus Hydrogenedentota bacterium]
MSSLEPLLSVAMIVKDEEVEIAECIDNALQFADEVCVVDTGSSDRTVEIVRARGAKVIEIEWNDDFSYARNKSLELCTGKWIFVLDADERVSKDDGDKLRTLAGNSENKVYRIWTRNYVNTTTRSDFVWKDVEEEWSTGYKGWYLSAKVRLFPNDERIRFAGYVHETVADSAISIGMEIEDYYDVIIHHYPERKSEDRLKAKREKYLLLGLKKVLEQPNNPRFLAELAAQYVELGRFAEGLEFYRRALVLNPNYAEWWSEIGAVLLVLKLYDEAMECLQLAVRFDDTLVSAWHNIAMCYMLREEWAKAIEPMEKVVSLQPKNWEALEILGLLYITMGDRDKAEKNLVKSIEINPNNPRVIDMLKKYFSQ